MSMRVLSRQPPPPSSAGAAPPVGAFPPAAAFAAASGTAVSGSFTASASASSASASGPAGAGSNAAAAAGVAGAGGAGGVVVVGAIGAVEEDVAQLLDRLLDGQVFAARCGGGRGDGWEGEREREREEKERREEVRVGKEMYREERAFYVSGRGKKADGRVGSQSEDENAGRLGDAGAGGRRMESPRRKGGQEERKDGDLGQGRIRERGGSVQQQDRDGRKAGVSFQSKLKHYCDEDKGVLYVQFCWSSLDSLLTERGKQGASGRPEDELPSSSLEQQEAEGLRGLLFMFSVCHVILFVQEGAHFDPRCLRTFRILQSAKHSLAPFVKSQVLPGLIPLAPGTGRPSPLRPVSLASSNSSGRNGASGRQTSIIALMSGSAPVLFPGQCTPVILFVFIGDSADGSLSTAGRTEEATESGSSSCLAQHSAAPSTMALTRHTFPTKSSTATPNRSPSKVEAGSRKKMQTAIETQLRFLLKKCKTVATAGDPGPLGSGVGSGMGPRGPGSVVSSLPGGGGGGALFVLDPSRAVVLVERSSNQSGDSLDAATDALEDMLDGKWGSEDTLLDLVGKSGPAGEDLQIMKEFLSRQAEILRGRGGISNSPAGGSAGVGMVAAAAAAAAASAAAGSIAGTSGGSKPLCNPPELPSMVTWLAASRLIAEALSSCETRVTEDVERPASPRILEGSRAILRKGSPGLLLSGRGVLGIAQSKGTVEAAVACLEGGTHLDFKFSAAWCKRAMPAAREVYLKGLPPCYPTSLHNINLEKALRAFRSTVRGPAVPMFMDKLKLECETIWRSGRQLCDAESLTGRPCTHQVHEVPEDLKGSGAKSAADLEGKQQDDKKVAGAGKDKHAGRSHSSGVAFLHACACGRSRRLRKDPFDYESANVTFFQFPNCEDMLPTVVLPESEDNKPLGAAAWSLVRLGSAQYYQPSSGLPQSGFIPNQNHLAIWDLPTVYAKASGRVETLPQALPTGTVRKIPAGINNLSDEIKKSSDPALQVGAGNVESQLGVIEEAKPNSKLSVGGKGSPEEPKMGFLRAVSSVPETRKASKEVSTRLNFFGDPAFPPLPQKNERQSVVNMKSGKGSAREKKESSSHAPGEPKVSESNTPQGTGRFEETKVKALERPAVRGDEVNREPQELPKFILTNSQAATVTQHVRIYVGFEHECPAGHRFFLSVEHLDRLSPSFPQQLGAMVKEETENHTGSSKQAKQDRKAANSKPFSSGTKFSAARLNSTSDSLGHSAAGFVAEKGLSSLAEVESFSIQEGSGEARTLLNTNLPVFMNCPHCEVAGRSPQKKDGVVFAGTVSQLQRIFLVTPPSPLLLASCPIVEFGESYAKPMQSAVKFSVGCDLVLPPDSFLSLRLPFVYFTELNDGTRMPLLHKRDKPEHTAWLLKGTALFTLTTGAEKIMR